MTTPLGTEEGLRAYLVAKQVEHTSIELLTGGTANYVYRVTLPSGQTIVYKHAAPFLQSNTNFAFDSARMDYEDRALEILPPLLSKQAPDSRVHAVEWHSYDREQKLLCIGDGGIRHLKSAYTDPSLDITAIGREIGQWIAALHLCSTSTSLSLTNSQDLQANNDIGVNIYRYSYLHFPKALSDYNHDPSLGESINDDFGSRLATDNECVCHGDFWPGNVLVNLKDGEKSADLTVVDWEMVRRGTSATDVAQFAAESFLLDRFRENRGLLPVFLDTYASARSGEKEGHVTIGREWVRRMAVHWGVHVAFWPTRVDWTDREGTQKLVDIGVEVIRAAVEGDWNRLEKTDLFNRTGGVWRQLWVRM